MNKQPNHQNDENIDNNESNQLQTGYRSTAASSQPHSEDWDPLQDGSNVSTTKEPVTGNQNDEQSDKDADPSEEKDTEDFDVDESTGDSALSEEP